MSTETPDDDGLERTAGTAEPSVVDETALLEDRTNRRVLALLAELDPPVSVLTLATALAADRRDCEPAAVTRAERRRVQRELLSDVVPALEAAAVVRFDPLLATVEPTDRAETLREGPD